MSIGALRKPVLLQSENLAPDGFGGQKAVWTTLAILWAEIKPFAGKDAVDTGNFNKRLTHQITVRFRADIATGQRLLYGARAFVIRAAVNKDESNRWLDLLVEEGGTL
jgi:SPP1 family predicted phage head-tail adaptor